MLAILYHSFYKWKFRGVAPQQGFHSACYRFRHPLKGGTVYNYALSGRKFRLSFFRRALPYAI